VWKSATFDWKNFCVYKFVKDIKSLQYLATENLLKLSLNKSIVSFMAKIINTIINRFYEGFIKGSCL